MVLLTPDAARQIADIRAHHADLARELETLRRAREDLTSDPPAAGAILDTIRAVLAAAPVDSRGRVAELDTRITEVESDLSEIQAAALAAGIAVIAP